MYYLMDKGDVDFIVGEHGSEDEARAAAGIYLAEHPDSRDTLTVIIGERRPVTFAVTFGEPSKAPANKPAAKPAPKRKPRTDKAPKTAPAPAADHLDTILRALPAEGTISGPALREKSGVNGRAFDHAIQALVADGRVVVNGKARGTTYRRAGEVQA